MIAVTNTGFVIENATWYTMLGGAQIGIIKGKTDHGEVKYYIGTGTGIDEEMDALGVAMYGSRFYPEIFAPEVGQSGE